jgi:hypothetical protein
MANRRSVMRTLVAGAASIGAPRLFAQDDKSTVTVLVGAATTMDATARLISEHLREALGRPSSPSASSARAAASRSTSCGAHRPTAAR